MEKSPATVTLREIVSMAQVRLPVRAIARLGLTWLTVVLVQIADLARVIRDLVDLRTTWAEVQKTYPTAAQKDPAQP